LTENSKHIDQLITRYLSGEGTKSEMLLLERWMAESAENKKYFEGIQFVHEKSVASYPVIKFNVDAAWNKLHGKMKEEPMPKQIKVVPFYSKTIFRLAASIAILIGLSVILFLNYKPGNAIVQQLAYTSADSTVDCSIDSNTHVFLNKNTKLAYTEYKNRREATLKGEAYFNIKHSEEKPFIVSAEGTLVKDIGTSYNVKAYDSTETVEVFVESGSVMFYTANNPGILINAGETGVYNKKTGVFSKKVNSNANDIAYKTGVLEFKNEGLSEIISKLEASYKVSFLVQDTALLKQRLTVTFDNEDIASVLNIISETMNVRIDKTNEGYTIVGLPEEKTENQK
jgi:transmembrane sensor